MLGGSEGSERRQKTIEFSSSCLSCFLYETRLLSSFFFFLRISISSTRPLDNLGPEGSAPLSSYLNPAMGISEKQNKLEESTVRI